MMHYSFIGSAETVEKELLAFINKTGVNEIMVVSHIYEHKARLRSYEILNLLTKQLKNPLFDTE